MLACTCVEKVHTITKCLPIVPMNLLLTHAYTADSFNSYYKRARKIAFNSQ